MKRILPLLLSLAMLGLFLTGSQAEGPQQIIYQVSTIAALKQGVYDGPTTFEALRKEGDFGLGTLNALDGEMVALDGSFYQVRLDGKVYPIGDSSKTPFAVVTFFKATSKQTVSERLDKKKLQRLIDERLLPDKGRMYAIRIHGTFDTVKVRSVPRQQKPYPSLAKALEKEAVFNLKDVKGTLVGYRFPDFMSGINVAGYHFHFITDDKKAGGHVLDCTSDKWMIELAEISDFRMTLPDTNGYARNSGTTEHPRSLCRMTRLVERCPTYEETPDCLR